MSTLDINAIRDYLLQVGCKIEYPILVNAFKKHLYNPDPDVQGKVRTQFKDYVNRLATVSLENNMKFIILRPEFSPLVDEQPKQNEPVMKSSFEQPTNTAPPARPTHTPATNVQPAQYQQPTPWPPPPIPQHRVHLMQRPESLNLSPSSSSSMPPPRPPPRRRQSTASLFKPMTPNIEKSHELQDLAKKSTGRVKEHAIKLNSSASSCDLNALLPSRGSAMKENRLSRDSTVGSLSSVVQRSGSHLTTHSRSSHREDESDSSSLQPIDPLRRKWVIEACNCNYNGLVALLKEDPKLASFKDITNGYTALHWAAKFGNLDIINLIAGTYKVSSNIKSSAGHTPLHIAYIFNRIEAANLFVDSYKANIQIRDHSGKRPWHYCKTAECPNN